MAIHIQRRDFIARGGGAAPGPLASRMEADTVIGFLWRNVNQCHRWRMSWLTMKACADAMS
jgi:hypothetical protein